MRVSDDRYDRDRIRFDLALRMVHHGARTRTICRWTGLTDDRLRKLCRAYQVQRCERNLYRLRTKVPHHASSFLGASMLSFEASTLASLFLLLGLVPSQPLAATSIVHLSALQRCETFCEAYEIYLVLYPSARMSFEQAWFLLSALIRRDGIKLNSCGQCGRLFLSDPVRIDQASCGCGKRRLSLPRRRRKHDRVPRLAVRATVLREGQASQQSLLEE